MFIICTSLKRTIELKLDSYTMFLCFECNCYIIVYVPIIYDKYTISLNMLFFNFETNQSYLLSYRCEKMHPYYREKFEIKMIDNKTVMMFDEFIEYLHSLLL